MEHLREFFAAHLKQDMRNLTLDPQVVEEVREVLIPRFLASGRMHLNTMTRSEFDRRFADQSLLGKGANAEVFRAIDTAADSKVVALKVVDTEDEDDIEDANESSSIEYALNQIFMEVYPRQTGLGRISEIFLLENKGERVAVLVMDMACCVSLLNYALELEEEQEVIEPDALWAVAYQLCCTVMLLHSLDMSHNDIKPENIVFDPTTWTATLIDMGLGCVASDGQALFKGFTCGTSNPGAGTRRFVHPSILKDETGEFSAKKFYPGKDMWSLGATLYLVGTGKMPRYDKETQVLLQRDLPDDLYRFLDFLLSVRPDQRIEREAVRMCVDAIAARLGVQV